MSGLDSVVAREEGVFSDSVVSSKGGPTNWTVDDNIR